MVVVIILVIFIALIVGGVLMVKTTLAKLDSESTGISVNPEQIRVAQEFLPFNEIEDNMIDLGGFKYRKIIECSSINYQLKTNQEKEMIEASFTRFLHSFHFPVTIYIQTRELDSSKSLLSLRNSVDEIEKIFPLLKSYGENYYSEMCRLPELTGNSKQKKKYIIIGYDEAATLEELNDSEKREYAMNELSLRVQSLIDNLSGMGIKAWELNTAGILELVYSTYHKDDYSNFEYLLSRDYTTLITGCIDGKDENGNIVTYVNRNILANMTDIQKTENALDQAKHIIRNEILSKVDLSKEDSEIYKDIVDGLDGVIEQLKEIKMSESEDNK